MDAQGGAARTVLGEAGQRSGHRADEPVVGLRPRLDEGDLRRLAAVQGQPVGRNIPASRVVQRIDEDWQGFLRAGQTQPDEGANPVLAVLGELQQFVHRTQAAQALDAGAVDVLVVKQGDEQAHIAFVADPAQQGDALGESKRVRGVLDALKRDRTQSFPLGRSAQRRQVLSPFGVRLGRALQCADDRGRALGGKDPQAEGGSAEHGEDGGVDGSHCGL